VPDFEVFRLPCGQFISPPATRHVWFQQDFSDAGRRQAQCSHHKCSPNDVLRLTHVLSFASSVPMWVHEAARNGDLEKLRRLHLMSRGTMNVIDQVYCGMTPLALGAREGHIEVVRYLLQRGAVIDLHLNGGWTPLSIAAHRGHLEVVDLLLEWGADPAGNALNGGSPLRGACQAGRLDVVRRLLSHGCGDIDSRNSFGETALLHACTSGHAEIARLLLDAGADSSIPTATGVSALSLAQSKGYMRCVGLLQVSRRASFVVVRVCSSFLLCVPVCVRSCLRP
jgi:ankyrin repeat protein